MDFWVEAPPKANVQVRLCEAPAWIYNRSECIKNQNFCYVFLK